MTIGKTTARVAHYALAVAALCALSACDDKSPLAPSAGPAPVSIVIGGTTSLDRPGDTTQLTATVTFSDQTSRDVTGEARWFAPAGAVTVTAQGVVTAQHYGVDHVSAMYKSASAIVPVRVAPAGACVIEGHVTSAAGQPLANARVEFSSRCGTMSMTTDEQGAYWLPAEGAVIMRVEKDGFQAETRELTVEADGQVNFMLKTVETAGSVTGTYRLTVTASPSCVLPADVLQRSYDAQVFDIVGDLFVKLSGADLVAWAGETGFTGTRNGSAVQFVVRNTFDDGYNFVERIGPRRDLYYSGTATGAASETAITATFSGTLDLRDIATCTAQDHRFDLVRRDR